MGFGVEGLGFRVSGVGFGVTGLRFGVSGLGLKIWGLGFGIWEPAPKPSSVTVEANSSEQTPTRSASSGTWTRVGPLGRLGYNLSQHSPTRRPSVERTAEKAGGYP